MDQLREKLARLSGLVSVVVATTLAATAGCSGDVEVSEPVAQKQILVQGEGGARVSLDSALTLFRLGLEPIDRLHDAAQTPVELIDRLVRALHHSDTATLRSIVVSRREFAYLFYPSSHFTRAPTKQEPGLAWFLHLQASEKGVTRLLSRLGGESLMLLDSRCSAPVRMGPNLLWSDCAQRVARDGDTLTMRLIGGVLERDGRFKIYTYANDF